MFETTEVITNQGEETIEVCFEPWGMLFPLAPRSSLRVEVTAEQPGELEIDNTLHRIVLFAWPSSTLKVFSDERVIADFPVPVPDLPPGVSTRTFLGIVFGQATEETESG